MTASDGASGDGAAKDAAATEGAAGERAEASDGAGVIADRYRLLSELGRGAMGVVWLARDERLGRTVAVKQLRPGVGLGGAGGTLARAAQLRARREARIAARLHHPHAVAVYDVVDHDGRPCLVMEYVPSRSLAEVLADGTLLPPAKAAVLGEQMASALGAAHAAGIVHRDVKPGNILLTDDGTAKLTDFGISRAAGDVTVTATGEMLGTPAYVAPEVAQGRAADAASDVFSLGATLYAATEGVPPFGTGPTAMALLLRIVNDEVRQPEQSSPLTDTVMWMLRNDPADRPSLEEVGRALHAFALAAAPEEADVPLPSAPSVLSASPTDVDDASAPDAAQNSSPGAGAGVGGEASHAAAASGPVDARPGQRPAPAAGLGVAAASTPAPSPASASASASGPAAASASAPASVSAPESGSAPAASSASAPVADSVSAPVPPSSERTRTYASRRRRLMPWVLLGGAGVVTAGVVAAIVAGNGPGGSTASPAQTASSAHSGGPSASTRAAGGTATASSGSSASSSARTSAPSGSQTSATGGSPTPPSTPTSVAAQLASTISAYYQLVPGHLDQAWGYMTADYQQNHAGGFTNYSNFWKPIQRVSLSDLVAQQPSTVVVTIDYYYRDGHTVQERTSFGLVRSGGGWKIASSSVQSSKTL